MSKKNDPPRGRDEHQLDPLASSLAEDVLSEDYPMSAVDDELRALGADPDAIGERAREVAWIELERRRRSWMARARDKLEAARRLLVRKAELAGLGRAELLDRIQAIASAEAAPIAAAFRKRTAASASDDELRELLAEMELVRELAREGRAGGTDDPE